MAPPRGAGRGDRAHTLGGPSLLSTASRALASAAAVRDMFARGLTVPGVLLLAAALDTAATFGTDYGSRWRGQAVVWLAVTVLALWRTYRGGATARRVARGLYFLGVFVGLLVVLPTFSTPEHRAWWVVLVVLSQVWNLLAITSRPVRAWVGDLPLAK